MRYLTPGSEGYPQLLQTIHSPPSLYVQGEISALTWQAVSIIGTRKPSEYGIRTTCKLVKDLSRSGCCFVSGLAYGIDVLVHQVALQHSAPCVAVLAGGLDSIYPAVHTEIARRICQSGGCLLTEYPPGVRPRKYSFLQRNRIVAALSPVTVVIEAAISSGTYSTAQYALQEGRAVAVVLGDIESISSEGCYRLYREGAQVVANAADILALAAYETAVPARLPLQPALTGSAAIVYRALSDDPASTETLARRTNLPIPTLQSVLSVLELDGYISQEATKWHKT